MGDRSVKDILGNEIEVGDMVAVAMSLGRSVELRLGDVIELIPDKNTIRVKWTKGGYTNMVGRSTLIEARANKILTVK